MSHTPGPWTAVFGEMSGYDCMTDAWNISPAIQYRQLAQLDLGSCGQKIRQSGQFSSPEAEANARLMAAAPELYEALKALADVFKRRLNEFEIYPPELNSANAALRKVEGR